MPDRAVSDALGFVLVFSLILSSVSVVYVAGFGGLKDVRDEERVTNAVRAFDVLADNFDDIYRKNAPSRATEIKLSGATLSFGERTKIKFLVTNHPIGSYNESLEPLVYRSEGTQTKLVYSNGAVFRTDRSASVFTQEPDWVLRSEGDRTAAVIPVVELRSTGTTGVGGSSTVLVRGERVESERLVPVPFDADDSPDLDLSDDDPDGDGHTEYNLTVIIETNEPRAQAWERYVETQVDWKSDACSVSGGDTVTCSFPVDELSVSVTRIDGRFA